MIPRQLELAMQEADAAIQAVDDAACPDWKAAHPRRAASRITGPSARCGKPVWVSLMRSI
jgi:hypothetical protein